MPPPLFLLLEDNVTQILLSAENDQGLPGSGREMRMR